MRRTRVTPEQAHPWPDEPAETDAVRTTPLQEPVDETSRMPGWVMLLMGIGFGAAGALLFTSGSDQTSAVTTTIPVEVAAAPTTTPEQPTTTTPPATDEPVLARGIFTGRVLATLGAPRARTVEVWAPGHPAVVTPIPDHSGSDLVVDAGGSYYAFTGPAPMGHALYVGRAAHFTPVSGSVVGHAWHSSAAGSLAWIEASDAEAALRIADVAPAEWTRAPVPFTLDSTTVAPVGAGEWLVAYDEHGFVVAAFGDRDDRTGEYVPTLLRRLSPAGVVVAEREVPADARLSFGPGGHGLIGHWNEDGRYLIAILGPTLDTVAALPTSPDMPWPADRGIAWAPGGDLVAVVTGGENLDVWTPSGDRWSSQRLWAPVRSMAWSGDGLHLVVLLEPGNEIAFLDRARGLDAMAQRLDREAWAIATLR